jgi:hypothetical protein
MPPGFIMVRVFALFVIIAIATVAVSWCIGYLLRWRASIAAAKVDANDIVEEANAEKEKEKIYKDAADKISKMRKK